MEGTHKSQSVSKKKKKVHYDPNLATKSVRSTSVTEMTAPARYGFGDGYSLVEEPCVASFHDVAAGKAEVWLMQLPQPLSANSLDSMKLKLGGQQPTEEFAGNVESASGKRYNLSVESHDIAQQLHVLVPCGEGEVQCVPVHKRVTLVQDVLQLTAVNQSRQVASPHPAGLTSPSGQQELLQENQDRQQEQHKKKKKKKKDITHDEHQETVAHTPGEDTGPGGRGSSSKKKKKEREADPDSSGAPQLSSEKKHKKRRKSMSADPE